METLAGSTLELDQRSEEVVVVASEDGKPSKKLITLSSSNVVLSNDDLLIELLLRLPVLSVLLFKSVSKQWLSLITDASFTLRRRQIPNLSPSGLFIRNPQSSFEYGFVSLNSELPSRRYSHKYLFSSRLGSGTKLQILQSCNGLLLCSTRVTSDEYYVYNPSTDLFKMLPSRHSFDCIVKFAVSKIRIAFDPRRSTYYKVVSADVIRYVDDDNKSGLFVCIQTYSSETGVWSVCDNRFPIPSFHDFDDGIFWNNAIHWLNDGKLLFKLDIADHPVLTNLQDIAGHPVLTTLETRRFEDGKVHSDSKLCESRGCLLLVCREFPDSLFNVYEMRNESSGWLLKYTVNLDDTMQFPEEWRVSSGVCCIVLEDREEDSYIVINISGEVWQYKFMFKTHRKICSLGSVESSHSDSFMFIPSFASV